MFLRMRGPAGTINDPVAVLARTRRRHRRGLYNANCCSQPPAPRDAQHVDPVAAELVENPIQQSNEAGKPIWSGRQRGSADARDIKSNDPNVGIDFVHERLQQLQTRPDTVRYHQRRSRRITGAEGRPHALLTHSDVASHFPAFHEIGVGPGSSGTARCWRPQQ